MAADEGLMWPRWVPVLAAGFSVFIAALAPFTMAEGGINAAVVVLMALAVIPWLVEAALGRLLPRPVFAAAVYIPIAVLNLAGGAFGLSMAHDGQLSFMLLTLAAGQLASTEPRSTPLYAGLAVLLPFGRFLVEPHFIEWIFWSAGILLGTGAGLLLRRQHRLYVQLQTAQAALADDAARQERRRIAREVHDVIAHSMTVSMLHVTAARLAVRRDPAEAEEALAEAERLGRQALSDVRRTVGLLHGGDDSATAAALPGATDLPELIADYAGAGLEVTFVCDADLELATPAGGLALYRAVQEGLANAAKHAPGAPVTVTVSLADDRLVAEVANAYSRPTKSTAPGLGLRGMAERVEALGGTVAAGPSGDGWVTSCAIPVQTTS